MELLAIRLTYSESKQCDSQHPVFPYADFFRSYTSLRGNAPALQKVADILPLTQGIKLLKASSLGLLMGSVWIPIAVMAAFMVICGGIAIRFFKWE